MRDGVALVRADQLPTPRFPREMAREEPKAARRSIRKDSRKFYRENRIEYDDEYAGGEREDDEECPDWYRSTSIKPQRARKARQIPDRHRPTDIKPQRARKSRQIPDGYRPTGVKPQWARKARQIEDCLVGLIDKGVALHKVGMYAPWPLSALDSSGG